MPNNKFPSGKWIEEPSPENWLPSYFYVLVELSDGTEQYWKHEKNLNAILQYWAVNGTPKVITVGSVGI